MRYKQTIKLRHGTVTLVYLIFDLYCCEYSPPPHHSQENARQAVSSRRCCISYLFRDVKSTAAESVKCRAVYGAAAHGDAWNYVRRCCSEIGTVFEYRGIVG